MSLWLCPQLELGKIKMGAPTGVTALWQHHQLIGSVPQWKFKVRDLDSN